MLFSKPTPTVEQMADVLPEIRGMRAWAKGYKTREEAWLIRKQDKHLRSNMKHIRRSIEDSASRGGYATFSRVKFFSPKLVEALVMKGYQAEKTKECCDHTTDVYISWHKEPQ